MKIQDIKCIGLIIILDKLLRKVKPYGSSIVLGHSRLITNGLGDNQPVVRGNTCVIHNGIIVNENEVWEKISVERRYKIDSEAIVAIAEDHLANGDEISNLPEKFLYFAKGNCLCFGFTK